MRRPASLLPANVTGARQIMRHARIAGGCLGILLSGMASPASAAMSDAEIIQQWDYFADDLAFGDPEWSLLGTGFALDIGTVREASWTLAWRQDGLAGAYLLYQYESPISPPELPAPGPMMWEEVEATFDCAARTVRLHRIYLYRPDWSLIGVWFDPQASSTPDTFDAGTIMGLAYTKVC